MRTLAIDTSGAACSIALFEDGLLIASRHEIIGRGHAEALIPWIAELPDGGRANRIMVGCGPGSFTGVRVGIAAARALGLAWGSETLGLTSFALIAAQSDTPQVSIAIEGGHGEMFVQNFENGRAQSELSSLAPEAAARAARYALVLGSAAERLVAQRGWGEARAVGADARHMLVVSEVPHTPPSPIYGRGADAKPMAALA
jgi:tRNA threonylcarbamoyladenosine biosynthesis protein TsaB